MTRSFTFIVALSALVLALVATAAPRAQTPAAPSAQPHPRFQTSHDCQACHNGISTPEGEDVSIGVSWRASMMANSARDPYWHASVRRETLDHPSVAAEIEDECSVCHMPMARTLAHAVGRHGAIFEHLPVGTKDSEESRLAADGVSCALCHQVSRDRLGTRDSFTGGFVVETAAPTPRVYGPFAVDAGRTTIMRSATGYAPTEASHMRDSELCATCHTLITTARGPGGEAIGQLPEQVPYLEWEHSAFRRERSCQSCHMPEVSAPTTITSVLGEPREGLARHTFIGGNFFMLRLLGKFRRELGVEALPLELENTARATLRQLENETAAVTIERAAIDGVRLTVDVAVRNLTGHKLPTGYPARRAWLHVVVRDAQARTVFESGALEPGGRIIGNDNDADPRAYEPHHQEIRSGDEVQIYESVMVDRLGEVTTGLLHGLRFVKDNRLLPHGFDRATAEPDIRVQGAAADDPDFTGGGDRVRYIVDTSAAQGPFTAVVELLFQPIGFRWAENLREYQAAEPASFIGYYESMAGGTAATLARATAYVR